MESPDRCPTESEILAFSDGRVDDELRGRIERHIDACMDCTGLLAEALRGESSAGDTRASGAWGDAGRPGGDTTELQRALADKTAYGQRIGRYVLLEHLGAGGMGVVYTAHDPRLERTVALKLLRPGLERTSSDGSPRARLLREAQAAARFKHPNVVTVYEVGEAEGLAFISLEHVSGVSVRRWMSETQRPRPWREVLGVFLEAGEGLAAAHRGGVLHRDFKPANILLDADGRAKVADFGLAVRAQDEAVDDAPVSSPELSQSLDVRMTQTGVVLGTPAFMAPEQQTSASVDARADQYSFAVSLYEALYGRRPFTGATMKSLLAAKRRKKIAEGGEHDARVPGWLRAVVLRGLEPDPDQRWPDMEAMLAALRANPGRRRWITALVVVALVVLAVVADGYRRLLNARSCVAPDDKAREVWSDEEAGRVRAAFTATGLHYAADAAARVSEQLAGYARAWGDMHAKTCELGRSGELSDTLFDLRMQCIGGHIRQFTARVELFQSADQQIVENASRAVGSLPPLSRCADPEYLTATVRAPEDPALAARVNALREQLDAVKAELELRDVSARADELLAQARSLEFAPLHAQAAFIAALAKIRRGEFSDATVNLVDAYHIALEAGVDEYAAVASAKLVFVLGTLVQETDKAQAWRRHAGSFVRRVGDASPAYVALENGLGGLALRSGDPVTSERHYRNALAWYGRARGPGDPDLVNVYTNLASALGGQNRWDDSIAESRRAIELATEVYGPEHPSLTDPLTNLGAALAMQGEYREAMSLHARALAIAERARGEDHVGNATYLVNLGMAQRHVGEFDTAYASYERARSITEQALGSEHPMLGSVLNNIADLQLARGDHRGALELLPRAREIWAKAFGERHRVLLPIELGFASAHLGLGDHDAAVAAVERGMALEGVMDSDAAFLGELYFSDARARWRDDAAEAHTRALARASARRSLELYAECGEPCAEERAAVAGWISSRE